MNTAERWRIPGPLVYRRPRYAIIQRGPDGIEDTFARLKHGVLAIDTETTDLPWWTAMVGSINLAAGDTAAFFYRDALPIAARWLSDQVKDYRTLVFHHAKFDMHQLRSSFGLHIPYPVHDTMVMSFMIDNRGAGAFDPSYLRDHHKRQAHSLKTLAKWYVDPHAEDAERELMKQIRARGGKHKGDWLMADEKVFGKYSWQDPWYTLQLYLLFQEMIDGWVNPEGPWDSLRSCYETERWLTLAFRDMEERGVRADVDFFEQWRRIIARRKRRAGKHLHRIAGRWINWNSPNQLRGLLYDKRSAGGLGITPTIFTAGGMRSPSVASTNKMALLLCGHEIAPALIDYRKNDKEESTYANALLGSVAPDGAIHPTFWQNGAGTNRTSCSDPNLQQQKRPEPGQKHSIREGFIPRKGLKLRFSDYNQLEMRIAASKANERTFIEGYRNDPNFDAHAATGMRMYGKSAKTLLSEERNDAKIMNFLKLFGGGPKKAGEQLQKFMYEDPKAIFRALRKWNYSLKPGEDPYFALGVLLNDRFNVAMPAIKSATYRSQAIAEGRGFVMTDYGHHRYMDPGKEYAAFNTDVQGTAGSLAKKGVVAVYRELQIKERAVALLLLIHDEIVYEGDGDPRVDRRVLELMQELKRYQVPIIADMSGSDRSWHHKEKIKI
jgi:DNA polymerase-1